MENEFMPVFDTPFIVLLTIAAAAFVLGSVPFGLVVAKLMGMPDPRKAAAQIQTKQIDYDAGLKFWASTRSEIRSESSARSATCRRTWDFTET